MYLRLICCARRLRSPAGVLAPLHSQIVVQMASDRKNAVSETTKKHENINLHG
jgi:hypothetical protein